MALPFSRHGDNHAGTVGDTVRWQGRSHGKGFMVAKQWTLFMKAPQWEKIFTDGEWKHMKSMTRYADVNSFVPHENPVQLLEETIDNSDDKETES